MRIEPTLLFSILAAVSGASVDNCDSLCKNSVGCTTTYCKSWQTPAVCHGMIKDNGQPVECQENPVSPVVSVSECPAVPAVSEDRRADHKKLTIMHWNVEWLFLPEVSYEGTGRPEPIVTCPGDCPWKTKEAAEQHLQEVAELMAGVQEADIVTFNEIQDCSLLKELNSRIPQDYTPYFKWSGDLDKSMNVGMLTRIDPVKDLEWIDDEVMFPLPNSECGYEGESKPYVSIRNYMTTFEIDGLDKPLTVIGAHLSSQPTTPERCARREAEALAITQRARAALARGHHVIVAGDMNDFDAVNLDKDGKIPTSRVLEQLKLDGMLETATQVIPREERYTYSHSYYGNNSLDHFLIDADLWQKVESVSIRHAHEEHPDHFPIIVTFDLKPKVESS